MKPTTDNLDELERWYVESEARMPRWKRLCWSIGADALMIGVFLLMIWLLHLALNWIR